MPSTEEAMQERRLQVQAYYAWTRIAGANPFPLAGDIVADNYADLGAHSFLLEIVDPEQPPVFRHIGDELLFDCEGVEQIETLNDVPGLSLISRLSDHYMQCIANEAPVGFEAGFINRLGQSVLYRGIIMPAAQTDNRELNAVWGVINCKFEDEIAAPLTLPKKGKKAREPQPLTVIEGPDMAEIIEAMSPERRELVGVLQSRADELMAIDGASGLTVIDVEHGLTILTRPLKGDIDFDAAATSEAVVFQSKTALIRKLGGDEEIDNILTSTARHYHIARALSAPGGRGLVAVLILDRDLANLALAQNKLAQIDLEFA